MTPKPFWAYILNFMPREIKLRNSSEIIIYCSLRRLGEKGNG